MPKRRSAAGSSEQMDGEGESQRGLSAPNRAGGTSEHFQLLRPGERGVVGRSLRDGVGPECRREGSGTGRVCGQPVA